MAQAALLSIKGPKRIMDLIHLTQLKLSFMSSKTMVFGSQQHYFGLS